MSNIARLFDTLQCSCFKAGANEFDCANIHLYNVNVKITIHFIFPKIAFIDECLAPTTFLYVVNGVYRNNRTVRIHAKVQRFVQ